MEDQRKFECAEEELYSQYMNHQITLQQFNVGMSGLIADKLDKYGFKKYPPMEPFIKTHIISFKNNQTKSDKDHSLAVHSWLTQRVLISGSNISDIKVLKYAMRYLKESNQMTDFYRVEEKLKEYLKNIQTEYDLNLAMDYVSKFSKS